MVVDAPRRYPLADLAEAMCESYNQACERLGIGGAERKRITANGGLSLDAAERFAIKAGFHPWNVWPDMVDHLMQDEGAVRTCTECGVDFAPLTHNQLTCPRPECRRGLPRRRDRERVRAKVARPDTTVCELPLCGTTIKQKPMGRPRRFCCDAHRQAFARAAA